MLLFVIGLLVGGLLMFYAKDKSFRQKINGLISRRPPSETQQVLPYEDLTVKHQIERSKERTK
jgi:hypothetical protein